MLKFFIKLVLLRFILFRYAKANALLTFNH